MCFTINDVRYKLPLFILVFSLVISLRADNVLLEEEFPFDSFAKCVVEDTVSPIRVLSHLLFWVYRLL